MLILTQLENITDRLQIVNMDALIMNLLIIGICLIILKIILLAVVVKLVKWIIRSAIKEALQDMHIGGKNK